MYPVICLMHRLVTTSLWNTEDIVAGAFVYLDESVSYTHLDVYKRQVDAYVCLNREGEPVAPNYFTQCFKQFLRDNDLREIRLHDLRHTCASVLIQNRVPLIEVRCV